MADVTTDGGVLYYVDHNGESWVEHEVQIAWPKARFGICGLGHVFEGMLYFTKDIVDDSLVPRNRKPKTIPKPEAKPAKSAWPASHRPSLPDSDSL